MKKMRAHLLRSEGTLRPLAQPKAASRPNHEYAIPTLVPTAPIGHETSRPSASPTSTQNGSQSGVFMDQSQRPIFSHNMYVCYSIRIENTDSITYYYSNAIVLCMQVLLYTWAKNVHTCTVYLSTTYISMSMNNYCILVLTSILFVQQFSVY